MIDAEERFRNYPNEVVRVVVAAEVGGIINLVRVQYNTIIPNEQEVKNFETWKEDATVAINFYEGVKQRTDGHAPEDNQLRKSMETEISHTRNTMTTWQAKLPKIDPATEVNTQAIAGFEGALAAALLFMGVKKAINRFRRPKNYGVLAPDLFTSTEQS